jgi:hypothetical protein
VGDARLVYNNLVRNPKETRLLRSPRLRWENTRNIGINLEEAGCNVNWSPLAQYMVHWEALVNKVMNLRIP